MKKFILNTLLAISILGVGASLTSCDKNNDTVPDKNVSVEVGSDGVNSLANELKEAFNTHKVESINIYVYNNDIPYKIKAEELIEVNDLYIKFKRFYRRDEELNEKGEVIYKGVFSIDLVFLDNVYKIDYDYTSIYEKPIVKPEDNAEANK